MSWQQELAGALGLYGRVLISPEGVNGTVSGSPAAAARFEAATEAYTHPDGYERPSTPAAAIATAAQPILTKAHLQGEWGGGTTGAVCWDALEEIAVCGR